MDKKITEQKTFMDKAFRDKDGHIAIMQMPNIPLTTWLVSTVLSKIITHGKSNELFTVVAYGALFTWALMEIVTGVNYFRRLFGLVVLVMLTMSKLK